MAFYNMHCCSSVFVWWTSQHLCMSCNVAGLMCYLWFSQRCFWVFRSSGVWHRVVGSVIPNASVTTDPTHRHMPEDLNLPIKCPVYSQCSEDRRDEGCDVKFLSTVTQQNAVLQPRGLHTTWNRSNTVEFITTIMLILLIRCCDFISAGTVAMLVGVKRSESGEGIYHTVPYQY
jgi:hypothetical protein